MVAKRKIVKRTGAATRGRRPVRTMEDMQYDKESRDFIGAAGVLGAGAGAAFGEANFGDDYEDSYGKKVTAKRFADQRGRMANDPGLARLYGSVEDAVLQRSVEDLPRAKNTPALAMYKELRRQGLSFEQAVRQSGVKKSEAQKVSVRSAARRNVNESKDWSPADKLRRASQYSGRKVRTRSRVIGGAKGAAVGGLGAAAIAAIAREVMREMNRKKKP